MKNPRIPAPGRTLATAVALLAAGLLAACYDNDSNIEQPMPAPSLESVPSSATASSRAYTMFATQLPASDSATPLRLDDYQAPTSETEAPENVT